MGIGGNPRINSQGAYYMHDTSVPGMGLTPGLYMLPLNATAATATMIGNYVSPYAIIGGVVADEQKVYWQFFGTEKGTANDSWIIAACPVGGCGNNPTSMVLEPTESGDMFGDAQALYWSTSAGIYKLAKF
jgi:hypothetical protein